MRFTSLVYAIKLAVSVLLIAFLAFRFDMAAAGRQLLTVEPWHGAGALALYMVFHLVNAAKLQILLNERPLRTVFAFVLMAQAYVLVLPGQLAGEAMKAYRLARGSGQEGRVVSSVAFDKVTSLIALLLTTLAGLLFEIHRFGDSLLAASLGGLVVIGGAAGALGLQRIDRFLQNALRGDGWRERLRLHLDQFFYTWRRHMREPRKAALSLAYGVAAQMILAGATCWLGAGLGISLSLALWCVVTGSLTIILLAPVTIGGLGLREASLVGMLGLFAVGHEASLALAFAILAVQLLIAAIGLAVDLLVLRDR